MSTTVPRWPSLASRRFLQRLAARLGIKASEVGADPEEVDRDDA